MLASFIQALHDPDITNVKCDNMNGILLHCATYGIMQRFNFHDASTTRSGRSCWNWQHERGGKWGQAICVANISFPPRPARELTVALSFNTDRCMQGERRRHPFSLDNGPDVVFMGQAEGYENVCSPAPPMLAGAAERVSGQTASHAAATAEGDITTEGEEQWAVRMEAVPLQGSEANASACRDRYMARKEASLRAELVRVHEVMGEMVSGLALLDTLKLISVVGMSMLNEVQEVVTAVLKALSTLMGSLTFQRGWFGFQGDVRKATAATALSSRNYSERTRDGDQAQASGRSSEQGAENEAEETRKQGAADRMLELQRLLHNGHTLLGAAIDSLALFSLQEQERNIQEKNTQRGDSVWATYLSVRCVMRACLAVRVLWRPCPAVRHQSALPPEWRTRAVCAHLAF